MPTAAQSERLLVPYGFTANPSAPDWTDSGPPEWRNLVLRQELLSGPWRITLHWSIQNQSVASPNRHGALHLAMYATRISDSQHYYARDSQRARINTVSDICPGRSAIRNGVLELTNVQIAGPNRTLNEIGEHQDNLFQIITYLSWGAYDWIRELWTAKRSRGQAIFSRYSSWRHSWNQWSHSDHYNSETNNETDHVDAVAETPREALSCFICGDTEYDRGYGHSCNIREEDHTNLNPIFICDPCVDSGVFDNFTLTTEIDTYIQCAACNVYINPTRVTHTVFVEGYQREPNTDSRIICGTCDVDDTGHPDSWHGCVAADCQIQMRHFRRPNGGGVRCFTHHIADLAHIHNYTYRPEPFIFHPSENVDSNALHIGLEIEMEWGGVSNTARSQWLRELTPAQLFYAKSDASIRDGFELVTQPFEPKWALEDAFPFDHFNEALVLGSEEFPDSCGMHIHMNKSAFSAPQLWKLIKLHTDASEFVGLIGGRGTRARYGRWPAPHDLAIGVAKDRLLEVVKARTSRRQVIGADGYVSSPNREIAINFLPEDTVELRYPRGSANPAEIRKNIEWAQALFDLTKDIKLQDVAKGALAEPGMVLWWLRERRDEYPALISFIEQSIPVPTPFR